MARTRSKHLASRSADASSSPSAEAAAPAESAAAVPAPNTVVPPIREAPAVAPEPRAVLGDRDRRPPPPFPLPEAPPAGSAVRPPAFGAEAHHHHQHHPQQLGFSQVPVVRCPFGSTGFAHVSGESLACFTLINHISGVRLHFDEGRGPMHPAQLYRTKIHDGADLGRYVRGALYAPPYQGVFQFVVDIATGHRSQVRDGDSMTHLLSRPNVSRDADGNVLVFVYARPLSVLDAETARRCLCGTCYSNAELLHRLRCAERDLGLDAYLAEQGRLARGLVPPHERAAVNARLHRHDTDLRAACTPLLRDMSSAFHACRGFEGRTDNVIHSEFLRMLWTELWLRGFAAAPHAPRLAPLPVVDPSSLVRGEAPAAEALAGASSSVIEGEANANHDGDGDDAADDNSADNTDATSDASTDATTDVRTDTESVVAPSTRMQRPTLPKQRWASFSDRAPSGPPAAAAAATDDHMASSSIVSSTSIAVAAVSVGAQAPAPTLEVAALMDTAAAAPDDAAAAADDAAADLDGDDDATGAAASASERALSSRFLDGEEEGNEDDIAAAAGEALSMESIPTRRRPPRRHHDDVASTASAAATTGDDAAPKKAVQRATQEELRACLFPRGRHQRHSEAAGNDQDAKAPTRATPRPEEEATPARGGGDGPTAPTAPAAATPAVTAAAESQQQGAGAPPSAAPEPPTTPTTPSQRPTGGFDAIAPATQPRAVHSPRSPRWEAKPEENSQAGERPPAAVGAAEAAPKKKKAPLTAAEAKAAAKALAKQRQQARKTLEKEKAEKEAAAAATKLQAKEARARAREAKESALLEAKESEAAAAAIAVVVPPQVAEADADDLPAAVVCIDDMRARCKSGPWVMSQAACGGTDPRTFKSAGALRRRWCAAVGTITSAAGPASGVYAYHPSWSHPRHALLDRVVKDGFRDANVAIQTASRFLRELGPVPDAVHAATSTSQASLEAVAPFAPAATAVIVDLSILATVLADIACNARHVTTVVDSTALLTAATACIRALTAWMPYGLLCWIPSFSQVGTAVCLASWTAQVVLSHASKAGRAEEGELPQAVIYLTHAAEFLTGIDAEARDGNESLTAERYQAHLCRLGFCAFADRCAALEAAPAQLCPEAHPVAHKARMALLARSWGVMFSSGSSLSMVPRRRAAPPPRQPSRRVVATAPRLPRPGDLRHASPYAALAASYMQEVLLALEIDAGISEAARWRAEEGGSAADVSTHSNTGHDDDEDDADTDADADDDDEDDDGLDEDLVRERIHITRTLINFARSADAPDAEVATMVLFPDPLLKGLFEHDEDEDDFPDLLAAA